MEDVRVFGEEAVVFVACCDCNGRCVVGGRVEEPAAFDVDEEVVV